MSKEIQDNEYIIKIDFDKNSDSPIEALTALAGILSGFHELNFAVTESINPNIVAASQIVELGEGSIFIKMKERLESVPDDMIMNVVKNPRHLIGVALVKAKHALLDFLDGIEGIPENEHGKYLTNKIKVTISEAGLIPLNDPDSVKLNNAMRKISDSAKKAKKNAISYISKNKTQIVRSNYNFIDESEITTFLPAKVINTIVQIKKAVYVGDAQWVVSYKKDIHVFMDDKEWLQKYQANLIYVPPGSSLRVLMDELTEIDKKGEIVGEPKYYIRKILEIIPPRNLFDE